MLLNICNVMLGGNLGFVIQIVLPFMLLMYFFSTTTKFYEIERNKKAINFLIDTAKAWVQKFIDANTFVEELSYRTKKVVKWVEITMYCIFSAYFRVLSLAVLFFYATSEISDVQEMLAILFIISLMLIGNMYHVAAKKCELIN